MNWADLQSPQIDSVWSTMGPPGPQGEQGSPGRDGSDGRDGADGQGLTLRGNWNRIAHYKPGDVVTHAFESYVARSANVGKRPTRGSRMWQLLAARGARGERGANEVTLARGPRGFAGKDGQTLVVGSNSVLDAEFGVPIPVGEPIYIAADSKAYPAQADSETTAGVAGFAVGDGKFITEGQTTTTGLVAGHLYYLGADGGITNTPPDTPGHFVVPIGRALSATVLDVELGPCVMLSGNMATNGTVSTLEAVFDSATVAGSVVYVSGSNTVGLAQANAAATTDAIGFAVGDVAAGDTGNYVTDGTIELAGLIAGDAYYLSADSPGEITNVAPSNPGDYVVRVGQALSETTLEVEIEPPILLSGNVSASGLVTLTVVVPASGEIALPDGAVVDSVFVNGLLESDYSVVDGVLVIDCVSQGDFVAVKYLGL